MLLSAARRYDFQEVGFNGVFCCLSFLAQDLLKFSLQTQLPKKWTESMLARGYERADKKGKGKSKAQVAADMAAKAKRSQDDKAREDE